MPNTVERVKLPWNFPFITLRIRSIKRILMHIYRLISHQQFGSDKKIDSDNEFRLIDHETFALNRNFRSK